MSKYHGTITAVGNGHPSLVKGGETVAFSISEEGTFLRRSLDLKEWEIVEEASPFAHKGEDAHYRIDCLSFKVPVEITFSSEVV